MEEEIQTEHPQPGLALPEATSAHLLYGSQHLLSGPLAIVWSLTNQLDVVCFSN